MLFCTQLIAADLILPLPRPAVDKELEKITSLKKNIYPQKKPTLNEKITHNESNQETEQIDSQDKIQLFIYPKKFTFINTEIKKLTSLNISCKNPNGAPEPNILSHPCSKTILGCSKGFFSLKGWKYIFQKGWLIIKYIYIIIIF